VTTTKEAKAMNLVILLIVLLL